MYGPFPAQWSPYLLGLLRVVAAFLFIEHGTQKLFAYPVLQPSSPADLFSLRGLAGVLETFGGLMLLLGIFTKPVAFLLSGEMAVAYFMSHAPRNFWPILNGGELTVLYCFVWLYFAAAGPGVLSVDGMMRRAGR